ncbi:MAG: hydantoinase/oxoprolinase family protein [Candidatus Eremiobacterota bacterium]
MDVGGTHTDGAALLGREVLAWTKQATTPDASAGIAAALEAMLREVPADRVDSLTIGTTRFTNAILERRPLARTACLRLCLPAGEAIPPFEDWAEDLARALGGHYRLLSGGLEFDGRPISVPDRGEVDRAADELRALGVEAVAVAGIFAPVDPSQEVQVAAWLAGRFPYLTCSHDLGRLGLLERENAALLNACLMPEAERTLGSLHELAAAAGLRCPLFLSQNDGTVLPLELARRFPVLTIASGPTNSLRGAALLAGVEEAVVIDVGGTSTDLGLLRRGFPREASVSIRVGGVRTNFRMPDTVSLALGGGSRVRGSHFGPDSVARDLEREALVFGGAQPTLTDAAVAAGRVRLGDPSRARVDPAVLGEVRARLEQAVDSVKLGPEPVDVIAVGGASFLVPDDLAGAARVLRPAHFAVANAVGAALSRLSGEADLTVDLEREGRDRARERALAVARGRAVAAGARPNSLEVLELEEVPVAYLPGNALRVRARVVGDHALPE